MALGSNAYASNCSDSDHSMGITVKLSDDGHISHYCKNQIFLCIFTDAFLIAVFQLYFYFPITSYFSV